MLYGFDVRFFGRVDSIGGFELFIDAWSIALSTLLV